MTLTDRSMEWLNQNRHRAYPMRRDEWRQVVPAGSGLDAVLLDALVFDGDASTIDPMLLSRVKVESDRSVVTFKYGRAEFDIELVGGETSGIGSYELRSGQHSRGSGIAFSVSLALSSHAYLKDAIGEGGWDLNVPILESRVLSLSDGSGVSGITTQGSKGVDGRDSQYRSKGDVVLEDGYCTSPIIRDGRILVRVGRNYGLNPCGFDFGGQLSADCASPLFFFCGQNAINSGNVIVSGGKGVAVTQGRSYAVRTGSCAGKTIPCVEITATSELMELYRPVDDTSSSEEG
jgi:hypothetical protein